MASYNITRKCGHEETVKIYGPYKGRDSKAEWEATRLCRECYDVKRDADRAAATAKATEAAKVNGLPALEGSAKQIAWAETIRCETLDRVNGYAPTVTEAQWARMATKLPADLIVEGRKLYAVPMARLEAQTSAKWWIDHGSEQFGTAMAADKVDRQNWADRCKVAMGN